MTNNKYYKKKTLLGTGSDFNFYSSLFNKKTFEFFKETSCPNHFVKEDL